MNACVQAATADSLIAFQALGWEKNTCWLLHISGNIQYQSGSIFDSLPAASANKLLQAVTEVVV